MPYSTLDQNGLATPDTLLEIPKPDMHPVMIARHMLLLATFLQHLHPDLHKMIKGLSESPQAMSERLTNLAVSLVTINDELLGSIEGLECVMIESVYQANIGNIRRSWVSGRRAMSIAQLMGLNRPNSQPQYKVLDPKTKYHPYHMWFRIVFLDRYLSLLLGVSQGCLDRSMTCGAMFENDTPIGRLERMHCVIASRILERNESHPSSHDFALTRTVDLELQRAARSLPSKWWLTPNLKVDPSNSQSVFWNTRRLFAQVLHYNLLNQLHLPYMLCSLSAERTYEYSRITCVNASREMLSRFILLRSFNGMACSCRTVDFLALMAAMTLLLAHLDSHFSGAENLLAHQYHSDRAMIEQVQENMKEVNRLNSDALSAKSADLLSRLLAVDIETVDCDPSNARRVSVKKVGNETALPDQDDDAVVSVHIPYFGIIKIARDGVSKEVLKPQATTRGTNRPGQSQAVDMIGEDGPETFRVGTQARSSRLARPSGASNRYSEADAHSMVLDAYTPSHAQQNSLSDPLQQYNEWPGLAAGSEDWAFQGVDLAFFESLMRSAGNDGPDWTMVGDTSISDMP